MFCSFFGQLANLAEDRPKSVDCSPVAEEGHAEFPGMTELVRVGDMNHELNSFRGCYHHPFSKEKVQSRSTLLWHHLPPETGISRDQSRR